MEMKGRDWAGGAMTNNGIRARESMRSVSREGSAQLEQYNVCENSRCPSIPCGAQGAKHNPIPSNFAQNGRKTAERLAEFRPDVRY
jgi:hypothetical protein